MEDDKKAPKSTNTKKGIIAGAVIIVIFVLTILAVNYFRGSNVFPPIIEYAKAYSLTNDTVSEGGNIVINAPKDMTLEEVKTNISFSPEIKGTWSNGTEKNQLLFKADKNLEKGSYYKASIKTKDGVLNKDFKVVDAPKILNIIPNKDSEANEKSNITIMFNRPIVPLTTIGKLSDSQIPAEISPNTKGKWKWIGTQTLQFQPDTTLIASSDYTVKVKSGFVSMDSLPISEFSQNFKTRPIRYESITEGSLIYDQPIKIVFNQPANLDKIKSEITVEKVNKANDNKVEKVDAIIEYGKKTENNIETTDESQIWVFNAKDKFGRDRFWDFETDYSITINKAFAKEGNITEDTVKKKSLTVTGIIDDISQASPNIDYITPYKENGYDLDVFDKDGILGIKFFEDIDKDKSLVEGNGIASIEYGQKCKDEDNSDFGTDVACEKINDTKTLAISFNKDIAKGTEINLSLKKIINKQNIQINSEDKILKIKVAEDLKISKVFPDAEKAASLYEMYICSNNPILTPDDKDMPTVIESKQGYKLIEFRSSNRNSYDDKNNKCKKGEFQTFINWKLAPETEYKIKLNLEDVFGGKSSKDIEFKTTKMADSKRMFYNVQGYYNITTPDKLKLTYAVENIEYLDLQICKLEPEQALKELGKYSDRYKSKDSNICTQAIDTVINLDQKYWDKNYFQVDLNTLLEDKLGHYELTFSNPNYKDEKGTQYFERSYVTITNLGIVKKEAKIYEGKYSEADYKISDSDKTSLKNLYWITDLKSVSNVSDAEVNIYKKKFTDPETESNFDIEKNQTGYTNNSGVLEESAVANMAGIIVTKGNDSAILVSDYSTDSSLNYGSAAMYTPKLFLYTDRPIYRPGDEVNIKGIYRTGYDGNFKTIKGKKIKITLNNSKYEEVETKELEINEYGSFSTKFILSKDATLGSYSVYSDNGYLSFDVEEYTPSSFKLDVTSDKEEYVSKDNIDINIDANYYFGVPLEGGSIEYTVTSQDYYFDKYTDEYFSFGSGWYDCYMDCSYGDKYLFRNNTKLDSSGKSKISFNMDFDKFFKNEEDRTSKLVSINITAKNINGQSVSAQKSVIVHAGEYYLGVNASSIFNKVNEKFDVKVKSVTTEGKTLSISDAEVVINKIKWVNNKRKEIDGTYYYNWEKQYTQVIQKKFNTDGSGNYKDTFSLDQAGEYEITVKGKDKFGNTIFAKENLYIFGNENSESFDSELVKPTNNTDLEIDSDKTNLNIGDTGNIVIKNPYKNAKALIAIERGIIYQYKVVDINENLFKYDFKVENNYIPNVFVTVTLISNEGIKFGSKTFSINTDNKKLTINVKKDKESYLPGDNVNLDIETLDINNKPVQSELSLAIVDLSVLALKGNPKLNPLAYFYSEFPLNIETSSNIKNLLKEINIKKGKGGDGGKSSANRKRGEFKDTAYWNPLVTTDANGHAKVSFKIPDNLTTWRIETVGVNKDALFGVDYQEFQTKKALMVSPIKPRFVIPGDEVSIGATIFNQSKDKQTINVIFASDTLKTDIDRYDIYLEPNKSNTAYFNVKVPSNITEGTHKFIISAKGNNVEDTVEQVINITRNEIYETVATSNFTNEQDTNEYVYIPSNVIPDNGSLTINSSATLVIYIEKALDSLLIYAYGCNEQLASKLDGLSVYLNATNINNLKDKLKDKQIEFEDVKYNINDGINRLLAKLYESRNDDGGFGFYKNLDSNKTITLKVISALNNLKKAGVKIDDNVLNKAIDFVIKDIKNDKSPFNISNIIKASEMISEVNPSKASEFMNQIKDKVVKDDKYLEKINNLELVDVYLIMIFNKDKFTSDEKDKIYKIIENKIKIDSRGAFLPISDNANWYYFETSEKNTAEFLRGIILDKKESTLKDKMIRWLLSSRSKDGTWGSTNSTSSVLNTLVTFLISSNESNANYKLDISLDNKNINSVNIDKTNIFTQITNVITPLNQLSFDRILPINFKKSSKDNLYYDIALKYYLPTENIAPLDNGFSITREIYKSDDPVMKNQVTSAKAGDTLKVKLTIIVPEERNNVAIEDMIPAGTEIINTDLDTENLANLLAAETPEETLNTSKIIEEDLTKLYPSFEEKHDDRLFVFAEKLLPGIYTYDYYIRALVPGKYNYLPASVLEMYFPENFGRTEGKKFEISK